MTSSGKNGLNIRTNASPEWDKTRGPEESLFIFQNYFSRQFLDFSYIQCNDDKIITVFLVDLLFGYLHKKVSLLLVYMINIF